MISPIRGMLASPWVHDQGASVSDLSPMVCSQDAFFSLQKTCVLGDFVLVKVLCEGVDLHRYTPENETLLSLATEHGHTHIAEYLIEQMTHDTKYVLDAYRNGFYCIVGYELSDFAIMKHESLEKVVKFLRNQPVGDESSSKVLQFFYRYMEFLKYEGKISFWTELLRGLVLQHKQYLKNNPIPSLFHDYFFGFAIQAIEKGNERDLLVFLDSGIDCTRKVEGKTLLYFCAASSFTFEKALPLLIRKGCNPNESASPSPVALAVQKQNWKHVEAMLLSLVSDVESEKRIKKLVEEKDVIGIARELQDPWIPLEVFSSDVFAKKVKEHIEKKSLDSAAFLTYWLTPYYKQYCKCLSTNDEKGKFLERVFISLMKENVFPKSDDPDLQACFSEIAHLLCEYACKLLHDHSKLIGELKQVDEAFVHCLRSGAQVSSKDRFSGKPLFSHAILARLESGAQMISQDYTRQTDPRELDLEGNSAFFYMTYNEFCPGFFMFPYCNEQIFMHREGPWIVREEWFKLALTFQDPSLLNCQKKLIHEENVLNFLVEEFGGLLKAEKSIGFMYHQFFRFPYEQLSVFTQLCDAFATMSLTSSSRDAFFACMDEFRGVCSDEAKREQQELEVNRRGGGLSQTEVSCNFKEAEKIFQVLFTGPRFFMYLYERVCCEGDLKERILEMLCKDVPLIMTREEYLSQCLDKTGCIKKMALLRLLQKENILEWRWSFSDAVASHFRKVLSRAKVKSALENQ